MTKLDMIRANYCAVTLADLEGLHTKQLLKLRDRFHHIKFYDGDPAYDFIDKLKTVLDTREHILNKEESKAVRKEKIKKGV